MFMRSKQSSILVLEHDSTLTQHYCQYLQMVGHQVVGYNTIEAALDYLECHAPDLVILDLELRDKTGLSILQYLSSALFEHTQVIITSSKPYSPLKLLNGNSYKTTTYTLMKPVGAQALGALVEITLRA